MLGVVARSVKDVALSMALKMYLNDRFHEYGEITDSVLDTEQGRLILEAMLRGERDPITATVERYELMQDGAEHYVVLKQFSSSREWLSTLLTQIFVDKRYPIPAAVRRLL